MQMDQDKLKSENTSLVAAFREKNRKHQQTQELYDRLKRKEMTAQTQSAAYESVDEVLGSVSRRRSYDPLAPIEPYQSIPRPQGQRVIPHFPVDHNGVEQLHTHQRSGSNGSRDSEGRMPPPFRRPAGYGSHAANDGKSCMSKTSMYLTPLSYCYASASNATPCSTWTDIESCKPSWCGRSPQRQWAYG